MAETTFNSLSSSSLKSSLQQTPPGNPAFVAFDDKYRCVVCSGIVREAVQTPCGHRACEQCIFQLLQGNPKKVKCPAGEETCSFLVLSEIHRDSGARREVRLLLVYCTFKTQGCETILPWKDLQDHEITCTYRLVECRFSPEGCNVVVIKRDIEIHQEQCPFRLESCRFCLKEIQNQLIQEHLEKTCPQYVIQCPYNCGTSPAPRVQMEQHGMECPRRPLKCKYHSIGCEFTGSAEEMELHTQSGTDSHIQLSVVRHTENGLDLLRTREVTQTMDARITELGHLMSRHSQLIEDLKEGVDTMKKTMKDIKLKVVAQTERLITVERKVENLADKEPHNKLSRDMLMLRETQNTLEGRINQLERAGPMGGCDGINGWLTEIFTFSQPSITITL